MQAKSLVQIILGGSSNTLEYVWKTSGFARKCLVTSGPSEPPLPPTALPPPTAPYRLPPRDRPPPPNTTLTLTLCCLNQLWVQQRLIVRSEFDSLARVAIVSSAENESLLTDPPLAHHRGAGIIVADADSRPDLIEAMANLLPRDPIACAHPVGLREPGSVKTRAKKVRDDADSESSSGSEASSSDQELKAHDAMEESLQGSGAASCTPLIAPGSISSGNGNGASSSSGGGPAPLPSPALLVEPPPPPPAPYEPPSIVEEASSRARGWGGRAAGPRVPHPTWSADIRGDGSALSASIRETPNKHITQSKHCASKEIGTTCETPMTHTRDQSVTLRCGHIQVPACYFPADRTLQPCDAWPAVPAAPYSQRICFQWSCSTGKASWLAAVLVEDGRRLPGPGLSPSCRAEGQCAELPSTLFREEA